MHFVRTFLIYACLRKRLGAIKEVEIEERLYSSKKIILKMASGGRHSRHFPGGQFNDGSWPWCLPTVTPLLEVWHAADIISCLIVLQCCNIYSLILRWYSLKKSM